VIAIDGPAGSGKSTVASGVAKALGLRRLDTGAMYRALTMRALERGINPNDAKALAEVARRIQFSQRDSQLLVGGRPLSDAIRRPEVSRAVSAVAAHRAVRRELVRKQRELIGRGGVVVEGRDIGTVVCPKADVKVFLTASPAERARRRHRELSGAGVPVSLPALKRDLTRRDKLDSSRSVSPLAPALDAVLVDSTGKTPRRVVAEIVRLARGLEATKPKRKPAARSARTSKTGSRRASRSR
jgi:cytidylate kinase